jgi:hypothetical protein
MVKPPPGAYRALFSRGLALIYADPSTTDEERSWCEFYREKLEDPSFKFGHVEPVGVVGDNHPFWTT